MQYARIAGRTSILARLATANTRHRTKGKEAQRKAVRETREELQQQAEKYLGAVIKPCEYGEAKASAERKLKRIIEREGDAGGARREPWYLAQLIAEAVKSSRLTEITQKLWELHQDIEQMGIKKGQPTLQKRRPSQSGCPYCSTEIWKMQ